MKVVDMDILKQRLMILIFGLSNFLFFYLLLTSIDLNIFLMTRLNFSILHLQTIKPLMMLLIFLSITHLLNNTSLYQGLTWGKPNKQSFVFLSRLSSDVRGGAKFKCPSTDLHGQKKLHNESNSWEYH